MTPTQIDYLKRRALVFVTDEAAGRVHVLDDRYRQSDAPLCVSADVYGEAEKSPAHQGSCEDGEVEQSRGFLTADTPFVALDMNSERLKVRLLTRSGHLHEIKADVMERSGWITCVFPILFWIWGRALRTRRGECRSMGLGCIGNPATGF